MSKYCIISKLLPNTMIKKLHEYGYLTIVVNKQESLNSELGNHPDILCFSFEKGGLVTVDRDLNSKLDIPGIIYTDHRLSNEYPNDCALNCLELGGTLFYNNPFLISTYGSLFSKSVFVKQGYVKCSSIRLNDSAVITSDPSLEKAFKSNGIEVLKVTNDGILLNGFSNGFIGGCAGIDKDKIFFTGCIEKYYDYALIKAFAKRHGIKLISLSEEPLYDYGGLIFV